MKTVQVENMDELLAVLDTIGSEPAVVKITGPLTLGCGQILNIPHNVQLHCCYAPKEVQ